LPLTSFATALGGTLQSDEHARYGGASTILAHAGPESIVGNGSFAHPLAKAVHLAFANHFPLTLTPDAIWTTVAQGFALHVRLNAEALRGRFVEHQGRKELIANCDGVPTTADHWAGLVGDWCAQIRAHVGTGTADFFLNTFSTSGPVERTASEIVMMDAFERYFSYVMRCICGIPRVQLAGTVDDWLEIRRRIELMGDCGVDDWMTRLRDICDQFVESARGRPDRDFWQCIYKPHEVYGGSVANGWLTRLFPYLETEAGFIPNRAITNGPSDRDFSSSAAPGASRNAAPTMRTADRAESRLRWLSASVSPSSFPNGLSRVPVTVAFTDRPETGALDLLGGLTGVEQDANTLALRPVLGWAVRTRPPQERITQTKEEREREFAEMNAWMESRRTH
jgi:hypothetical protein